MKKALAILATVATVAATTVSAPAQARGIGPGLAFGLAAGALVAGAAAASAYPYYYGPGYGYYDYGPTYYYGGPYAYYGGPVYYRHRYWHHRHYCYPLIEKPGASHPGFFAWPQKIAYGQNGKRSNGGRSEEWRAFSSVVTKYSSRSRSNFSCVALKCARRAMISSRSRAALS